MLAIWDRVGEEKYEQPDWMCPAPLGDDRRDEGFQTLLNIGAMRVDRMIDLSINTLSSLPNSSLVL